MGQDIKIIIFSSSDHNELVAEIYYKSKYVALVSQDDGINNLKIEFPDEKQNQEAILRNINLNIFLAAIEMAKKELLQGKK